MKTKRGKIKPVLTEIRCLNKNCSTVTMDNGVRVVGSTHRIKKLGAKTESERSFAWGVS